jgi:ABC-type glycerol-3-phosphate transport system permease component
MFNKIFIFLLCFPSCVFIILPLIKNIQQKGLTNENLLLIGLHTWVFVSMFLFSSFRKEIDNLENEIKNIKNKGVDL